MNKWIKGFCLFVLVITGIRLGFVLHGFDQYLGLAFLFVWSLNGIIWTDI